MSVREKLKKTFLSEKKMSLIFWVTSAFAVLLNLYDFFPITRGHLSGQLVSLFLSMDHALYESLQLPLNLWLVWVLCSSQMNPELKRHRFFRWGTVALCVLVFIEEISWGAVFFGNENYQWMVPYAKGVDFHNYDLRDTDASELIEAVVGVGICLFLIPSEFLRRVKVKLGVPEMGFSTFQYEMLVFANLTGLWALFHPSGKHDVFYENMALFTVLISVLRFNHQLHEPFPAPEKTWLRPLAYLTTIIMPVKFWILYEHGYFHPFAY